MSASRMTGPGGLLSSVAVWALITGAGWAQEPAPAEVPAEETEAADAEDRIVITGSRIRRNTFNSIAPIQVVDQETATLRGLTDVADILASTTVVNGVQETEVFATTGFISSGGPGSNTVSLRNLGPERTLVLINGRRFAPAGVQGAPTSADVSLIPAGAVERTEILLDGASAVYGSDAVAGVVNIILRDDFDGLEVSAFAEAPEDGGGATQRVSAFYGGSSERGRFTLAAEYFHREELNWGDRDWMFGDFTGADGVERRIPCQRDIDIDPDTGEETRICRGPFQTNAGIVPGLGLVFARPDLESDIGVPGWVSSGLNAANGDQDLRDPGLFIDAAFPPQYLPKNERFSFFGTAETDFELPWLGRTSAFLEASYSNRQNDIRRGVGQIAFNIPGDNPLNPFETDSYFLVTSPVRSSVLVEIQQTRLYTGLRGDFAEFGAPGWEYEAFAGYTRSTGFTSRRSIIESRLQQTLFTSREEDGEIVCGTPDSTGFPFNQSPPPCTPVDFFAPSVTPNDGSFPAFATQEELDFLAGERTFYTIFEQFNFGGFATGDLPVSAPGGPIAAVIGFEYREDIIDSRADEVAKTGDVPNTFFDLPTRGGVDNYEVYGELEAPLLRDLPFVHDLTVNLGGRIVDNEFFGENSVYTVKAGYMPFDWLTLRATYGTSFRAPNLNELFLGGQSGFQNANDPCVVPALAIGGDTGAQVYDPGEDADGDGVGDNDGRDPQIIANCQLEGLDPFSLGLNGGSGDIQVVNRGNEDLDAETSDALTIGAAIQRDLFDLATLQFGVSYFEVDIQDSVFNPDAEDILGSCYVSPDFPEDPFCVRRERDPETGFLDEVDATPFNIASRLNRGIDYNLLLAGEVDVAGRSIRLSGEAAVTQTLEQSLTIDVFDPDDPIFLDGAGFLAAPEWRGQFSLRAETGSFVVNWTTRWIGDSISTTFRDDPQELDDTRVATTGEYFLHTLAGSYRADTWTVTAGVRNLFNEDPPLIDQGVSGDDALNVPTGAGFDTRGRRLFVTLTKTF